MNGMQLGPSMKSVAASPLKGSWPPFSDNHQVLQTNGQLKEFFTLKRKSTDGGNLNVFKADRFTVELGSFKKLLS